MELRTKLRNGDARGLGVLGKGKDKRGVAEGRRGAAEGRRREGKGWGWGGLKDADFG